MTSDLIYAAGGTVQASGGIYIERDADRALLRLCLSGAFCYVLTSRQVGKSSLMVRTAERLIDAGCRPVVLDLTSIGVITTADAWYRSILLEMASQLDLPLDAAEWWNSRAEFAVTHRFTLFFHDLLEAIPNRIIVFVDEVDSTLALTFTDDFFAAVRALHNVRATQPQFNRLSFVVLGVATPSQLVQDPNRTPFNIGERIEITDFSESEARPLAEGLHLDAGDAETVLRSVLEWTGGHPYLTLRTFRSLQATALPAISKAAVEERIRELFFGQEAQEDTNLQFVREMLTVRARSGVHSLSRLLHTYRLIWAGATVQDQERDPVISHLKLSGIVKPVNGELQVRNRIYRETFGGDWVVRHMPSVSGQADVVYVAGGPVQAARGLYVERRTDALLLNLCRSGTRVHVLAPRQMGKTSLMVRAGDVLRKDGFAPAVVHLSEIGIALTERELYDGIVRIIADQLAPTSDVELWWNARGSLGAASRFALFLTEVVLPQVRERVVIFFDELEVLLELPFRDGFFATLHTLHSRATNPQLERLNFVLLGVGQAADYARDLAGSPFLASEALELSDYTPEEAAPLEHGLRLPPEQARDVLRCVLGLTGGHPYLTLRTFRSLQENPVDEWTAEAVTDRVLALFVDSTSEPDHHVQWVRHALTLERTGSSRKELLTALLNVWTGHEPDSDSGVHSALKTIGVVFGTDGRLEIRNRIYQDVFNPDWIRAQLAPTMPPPGLSAKLWSRSKMAFAALFGAASR